MWKPPDYKVAPAANTFNLFSIEQHTKMYEFRFILMWCFLNTLNKTKMDWNV